MCYRRERRKCVNAHACNMSLINCFCFPQNTLQFQYFLELWREFPHFSLTKQQDLYLEKIMLIFKQVKTKVSQKWLKGIVQPKTYSGSCYPKPILSCMEEKIRYLSECPSCLYFPYSESIQRWSIFTFIIWKQAAWILLNIIIKQLSYGMLSWDAWFYTVVYLDITIK